MSPSRRIILGIDYGTTNTSVSYAITKPESRELRREQVLNITNYAQDPLKDQLPYFQERLSQQVPSEVWYPDEDVRRADPLRYNSPEQPSDESDSEENGEAEQDEDDELAITAEDIITPEEKRHDTYWRDVPDYVRWGFEAQPSTASSKASEFLSKRNSPIKWAKLQLAGGDLKAGYSSRSRKSYHVLKHHAVVRKELDFITDFLTCLLKHVKKELTDKHNLKDHEPIEIVLCVPVIWDCKARRDTTAAMTVAMKHAGLDPTTSSRTHSLCTVYEPEAAAAYVLDEQYDIMPGSYFVLLDAGGGTVDAITYKVASTQPLRLEKQAVEASGGLCGSSFLNDDFCGHVTKRLKPEEHSITNNEPGLTLEGIIEERIMKHFENQIKRHMDFENHASTRILFDLPNLKINTDKGFYRWKLLVEKDEFKQIFDPRMAQVAALMVEQIERCRRARIPVQKVVLIGGYGDNKALQAYLESRLKSLSDKTSYKIQLKKAPEFGRLATAVSAGAVLWAFSEKVRPKRPLQSSYGLLRKEVFNRKLEGHRHAKVTTNPLEGIRYVNDTIQWEYIKGDSVSARPKPRVINTEHIFAMDVSRCVVKEKFMVSDLLTESHWQTYSSKNKRKFEVEGTFTVDMTDWRDRGLMERVVPKPWEAGKEHWAIQYDIIFELVGHTMSCSARFPSSGPRGQVTGVATGELVRNSMVEWNIAAAFEPGTR